MRTVLLVWVRSHPELKYMQGMHEILGGLYYVFAQSNCRSEHPLSEAELLARYPLSQTESSPNTQAKSPTHMYQQNEPIAFRRGRIAPVVLIDAITDPHYLEHDLYTCFTLLIPRLSRWYFERWMQPDVLAQKAKEKELAEASKAGSSPILAPSTEAQVNAGQSPVPSTSPAHSTTSSVAASPISSSVMQISKSPSPSPSPSAAYTHHSESRQSPYTSSSSPSSSSSSSYSPHSSSLPQTEPMLASSSREVMRLLSLKDPLLFSHLSSLGVEPHLFLMQWMRLLFLREFGLDDGLRLWDALFACGDSLRLMEWVAVSMMRSIRGQLMAMDDQLKMFRVLKAFPPAVDVDAYVLDGYRLCFPTRPMPPFISIRQEEAKPKEMPVASPSHFAPGSANSSEASLAVQMGRRDVIGAGVDESVLKELSVGGGWGSVTPAPFPSPSEVTCFTEPTTNQHQHPTIKTHPPIVTSDDYRRLGGASRLPYSPSPARSQFPQQAHQNPTVIAPSPPTTAPPTYSPSAPSKIESFIPRRVVDAPAGSAPPPNTAASHPPQMHPQAMPPPYSHNSSFLRSPQPPFNGQAPTQMQSKPRPMNGAPPNISGQFQRTKRSPFPTRTISASTLSQMAPSTMLTSLSSPSASPVVHMQEKMTMLKPETLPFESSSSSPADDPFSNNSAVSVAFEEVQRLSVLNGVDLKIPTFCALERQIVREEEEREKLSQRVMMVKRMLMGLLAMSGVENQGESYDEREESHENEEENEKGSRKEKKRGERTKESSNEAKAKAKERMKECVVQLQSVEDVLMKRSRRMIRPPSFDLVWDENEDDEGVSGDNEKNEREIKNVNELSLEAEEKKEQALKESVEEGSSEKNEGEEVKKEEGEETSDKKDSCEDSAINATDHVVSTSIDNKTAISTKPPSSKTEDSSEAQNIASSIKQSLLKASRRRWRAACCELPVHLQVIRRHKRMLRRQQKKQQKEEANIGRYERMSGSNDRESIDFWEAIKRKELDNEKKKERIRKIVAQAAERVQILKQKELEREKNGKEMESERESFDEQKEREAIEAKLFPKVEEQETTRMTSTSLYSVVSVPSKQASASETSSSQTLDDVHSHLSLNSSSSSTTSSSSGRIASFFECVAGGIEKEKEEREKSPTIFDVILTSRNKSYEADEDISDESKDEDEDEEEEELKSKNMEKSKGNKEGEKLGEADPSGNNADLNAEKDKQTAPSSQPTLKNKSQSEEDYSSAILAHPKKAVVLSSPLQLLESAMEEDDLKHNTISPVLEEKAPEVLKDTKTSASEDEELFQNDDNDFALLLEGNKTS
eukprot:MONOS_70.1-p1 / transcript=MONOS_70.1 / gene=MONOS_70 / organism=Monocercomonoides_exilis_PA203 / gene_product=Tre-2/Bub2/Cdc16 (TBC) F family protein E / transcript_product=Tre-2/Bub2/Cdc16 (TBC) F family protein E / location=Mono_scaffold00001:358987-362919(+) / protein_length=1311 / sequence_SO=supercontig / SO=protein_coding / is_pseudo=false